MVVHSVTRKCCVNATKRLLERGERLEKNSSRYPVGPTETERCIESLLAVFQRYAGKEGNSNTLSKKEFKTFMDTELASFTKSQKDPGVVDRMMKRLDMNNDGQLDFPEFLNLIGGLATACHEHMASAPPKRP